LLTILVTGGGFLFFKLFELIKGLINNITITMIIAVGIFTLLVDGKRYKKKAYIKELKIIKIISYSYISIGGLLYILLLFM
jgi:predicted lipid-binding transport protein (Tim44 family)